MNEGLSFEPVPEPPEQNRLFIIIAIGLVGMLVLGLLGIGGYVVFSRSKRSSQAQKIMQTTPIVLLATETPTVMATGTPNPTNTPTPIPTNTPVVLLSTATGVAVNEMQQVATLTPASGLFLSGTPAALTPGAGVEVVPGVVPVETQIVVIPNPTATPTTAPAATATPDTGIGLGALGFLGLGLAVVLFVARRARLGLT